jgi:hypothetical protein
MYRPYISQNESSSTYTQQACARSKHQINFYKYMPTHKLQPKMFRNVCISHNVGQSMMIESKLHFAY